MSPRNIDGQWVAGIDSGASTTKVVILDKNKHMVSWTILPTGGRCQAACRQCYRTALQTANLDQNKIAGVVSTGYGRKQVPFSNEAVTEITCHAKGVYFLFPGTRTIVDVGGQDSKVIKLGEKGNIEDFAMNDKCAAGTGRFLEVMARVLEVDVNDFGKFHCQSQQFVSVSSFCTVFAESEVVSLISEGRNIPDIIRGINASIADRIIALMKRVSEVDEITLTGGVAKNQGFVMVMEEQLKKKFNVPEEPQITGALGAALIAFDRCFKSSLPPMDS